MKNVGATLAVAGGICALALAAAATPAAAGVPAYLAHNGTGSACTLPTPCGDMTSALAAAGTNGEVICLDKGAYGPGNITRSVTISCGDGLWESPSSGASIDTPAGSDVVIEGLVADGTGISATPVLMFGQGTLHLRRVRVGNTSGSSNPGVSFTPNGPATLHIVDSVFYNIGGTGVLIKPSAGGSANVHIRNSRFAHSLHGLFADGTASTAGINVNIADSAFVDNQGNGIGAFTGNAPVTVSVTSSQITGNFTNGIGVLGTGGAAVAVQIGNSQITSNVTGIATGGSGQIVSFGGNQLRSNGSGNGPVSTVATQ